MNRISSIVAARLCLLATAVHADEQSDGIGSLNQLRTLGKLAVSFAASHGGRLPETLEDVIASQKPPNPSLLIAPTAPDKSKPSYELLLAGKNISKIVDPSRTVLVRSRYKLVDGRVPALFVDGHVELLGATQ